MRFLTRSFAFGPIGAALEVILEEVVLPFLGAVLVVVAGGVGAGWWLGRRRKR